MKKKGWSIMSNEGVSEFASILHHPDHPCAPNDSFIPPIDRTTTTLRWRMTTNRRMDWRCLLVFNGWRYRAYSIPMGRILLGNTNQGALTVILTISITLLRQQACHHSCRIPTISIIRETIIAPIRRRVRLGHNDDGPKITDRIDVTWFADCIECYYWGRGWMGRSTGFFLSFA